MEKNAKAVMNEAMNLLGYTERNGNERLTRRITNKAIPVLNSVYADIWQIESEEPFAPVVSLTDAIALRERAMECLVYGFAAFIAQSESDADNQSLWMSIYNKKRAGLSKTDRIQNVLP